MPATPPQPPDDEGTPLLQRQGWGLPDSWPLMAAYHDGETLVCRAASAAYARCFGIPADEVIGRPLVALFGEALAEQVQPFIAQALRSAEPCSCEQDLPQADSRRWALEFTFVPQRTDGQRPPGLHVLLTDLTRHRTAERALLESEERLAKFMQASVEGILFHRDGRIADANPAICELLGQTLHELLGRRVLDLIAPEQRLILDENPVTARATGRAFLSRYMGLANYRRTLEAHGFAAADLDDGVRDAAVDALTPHGSPAVLAAAVHAQLDAGADHVCVQSLPGADDPMPLLRALAAELAL